MKHIIDPSENSFVTVAIINPVLSKIFEKYQSELKEKAKEFIRSDKTREDLPEFELTTIKGIKDPVEVSKGIISLQNDRGTTYNRYIEIQDILVQAYNELRDEASFQYFQKKFDDLKPAQQDAIKLVYPQRISEAEPKNIGGK